MQLYKSVIQKRQTLKTAIAELFGKISNTKKISNKQFHYCEANIFLEKVTKSINSVSSKSGVISAIYIKKVIKKILQTADPSHSSLDVTIFLILNISFIILHNGYFRNF